MSHKSRREGKKMYFVSRKKYKIAQYQKERRRTDEKCFILVLKFSIVSNCQASSSVRKIYIYFHSHSSLLLSVRGKNPQNNRHAKKGFHMEIFTTDVYRLFNHQYERNNYFVHFPVTFSSSHAGCKF